MKIILFLGTGDLDNQSPLVGYYEHGAKLGSFQASVYP